MREIKFRAWVESILEEETGMYYPSALTLYKGEATMVADKIFAERGDDRFKFKDDTCKFTLMQYTGLKDKNGVEIYEGDIVSCDQLQGLGFKVIGIVHYSSGYRHYGGKNSPMMYDPRVYLDTRPFEKNNGSEHCIFHLDPEVIGNIYENPELLNATT